MPKDACACFNKLMDYGENHLQDPYKDDFFAVSLPEFLIFDEDMERKNKAHCYYLMGLSALGTRNTAQALDFNHQNCRFYKNLCLTGHDLSALYDSTVDQDSSSRPYSAGTQSRLPYYNGWMAQ